MGEQDMLTITRLQQHQYSFKQRCLWMPVLGTHSVEFDICPTPGGLNMNTAVRFGLCMYPDEAPQFVSFRFKNIHFPPRNCAADSMAGNNRSSLSACQRCGF